MRPHAVFRTWEGVVVTLGAGDIVGRTWCATLWVDDPRVSEAHAMVSLRGEQLRLLALRGRFSVGGQVLGELDLARGQQILLAPPDLSLEVLDVILPATVTALRGEGVEAVLSGPVGLGARGGPVPPTDPQALAWLWPMGEAWRLRIPGQPDREIGVGEGFVVGDRSMVLAAVAVRAMEPTHEGLKERIPLRLVARYETVHVFRQDDAPVILDGTSARLVSELVAFGVPVTWQMLAEQLWPGVDPGLARKRLDGTLARLRTTLTAAGLRSDLVRANGRGQIELLLEPGDAIEDQQ